MKKQLLFGMVMLCASLATYAQKELPSNFFLKTLPNGMEMLVIEDNSVPLVTLEIVVRNGAYTEDSAFNGLSHMYEHMFFKANKALPSQEQFLERVQELGVVFNGTTGDERVNYFITLSNQKMSEGLEFMSNAIRYPLFLEEEMKKENPVVDGEFQRNESNPVFFLLDDMNRHLWKKNYYRKNAIGLHDVILTCTPEKMRVIQEKYYHPNNSLLAVAGAVNHEEVFAQIEKYFGDWKSSGFNPAEKWPVPEMEPLKGETYYVTLNENAQVPIFMIGYHGPDTRHDVPSTYAADVFSYILGQSNSKLQKELVETGLAFQVGVSYQTCMYTGPIQIFMVPNPAKVTEAWNVLQKNIQEWADPAYYTAEMLETAKRQLSISETYSKETTSDYIHLVTYWWCSANLDYHVNYIENLNKVTPEDISAYVKKYIIGQPHVNGLLLNPAMKDMVDLKSIGFEIKE